MSAVLGTPGPEDLRIGGHLVHREKYQFKRRPYKHQAQALKKLLSTGWGGALLMEPRTGKTKVVIDYASVLHQKDKVSRVVVVCPLSVMDVWRDEIELNCPFPHRVLLWDKDARKNTSLPKFGKDVLDFVVINLDAFATPGRQRWVKSRATGELYRKRTRKGGRFEVVQKLKDWKPQLFVVDESHRIKNVTAKKTTSIVKFSDVEHRVIATGTVQTKAKRSFDIYSQWRFLNPENPLVENYPTLADFKDEFVVMTERNGYPQWLRNKKSKKLHRWMHQDAFSITRAECYDLPPRLPDRIIPVQLTGHTLEVYVQMAEEMIARIKTGEITEASIALVQTLRLAQITGGVATTTPDDEHPEQRRIRIGRDKLIVLEDTLEDLFEEEEKVVIAARFIPDLAGIQKLVKKMKCPVWVMHGGVKGREQRTRMIREFKEYDGPCVFAAQPQTAREGIDLSTAGTFIWYSLTSSWVDFTQVEDRIALHPRATQYIYLLAPGTVDMVMLDTLHEDGNVGRAIMKAPHKLLGPELHYLG